MAYIINKELLQDDEGIHVVGDNIAVDFTFVLVVNGGSTPRESVVAKIIEERLFARLIACGSVKLKDGTSVRLKGFSFDSALNKNE